MKTTKIVLVLLVILALLTWIRTGTHGWDIRSVLPFCDGQKPSLYSLAGFALLGLMLWGLGRLKRSGKDEEEPDSADPVADAGTDASTYFYTTADSDDASDDDDDEST